MSRATRAPVPHVIAGEDRGLGGSGLYVDLVPVTCWATAARTVLASANEWVRIRKMVYERAGNACEVCGSTRDDLSSKGHAPRLHAHERYLYLEPGSGRVQRLARLICQCVACDEVTHFGRAMATGYGRRAAEHALQVNGWTESQFQLHLDEAKALWKERSKYTWKLDVTVLRNAGGRIRPEAVSVSEMSNEAAREVIWDG